MFASHNFLILFFKYFHLKLLFFFELNIVSLKHQYILCSLSAWCAFATPGKGSSSKRPPKRWKPHLWWRRALRGNFRWRTSRGRCSPRRSASAAASSPPTPSSTRSSRGRAGNSSRRSGMSCCWRSTWTARSRTAMTWTTARIIIKSWWVTVKRLNDAVQFTWKNVIKSGALPCIKLWKELKEIEKIQV